MRFLMASSSLFMASRLVVLRHIATHIFMRPLEGAVSSEASFTCLETHYLERVAIAHP